MDVSIGLGDVAVPGLLACLALRFDSSRLNGLKDRAVAAAAAFETAIQNAQVQHESLALLVLTSCAFCAVAPGGPPSFEAHAVPCSRGQAPARLHVRQLMQLAQRMTQKLTFRRGRRRMCTGSSRSQKIF